MLIAMKREFFHSLQPDQLGRACIEPVLLPLRGKNPSVKAEVYQQLTIGQRALFMFHVWHDHANGSALEFYCWLAYTRQEFSYWIGIQAGLRFFGQEKIIALLEEMNEVLEERNQRLGKTMADVTGQDLEEDAQLSETVHRLYAHYQQNIPDTFLMIYSYIRSHPEEFVSFPTEDIVEV
ncbi:hypothetical protein [Brevibacillus sp. SIMBA_040]|uniref:hypothetical protein n=1 Tax=unclassified Brevibacillus TaxID=2684853 RepID=UPI00397B31F6